MSYVIFPQMLGLGASGSIGALLETPGQTLEQIALSTPTRAQVANDWAPAMDAMHSMPVPSSLENNIVGAASFMEKSVREVANATGIPASARDIAAVAQGLGPAAGQLINGNPGPLMLTGVKVGAAYGAAALGVSPEIATMTIEALSDGELSQSDFEAAGAVAGAVAGAAVCSMIGIPPCIGGWLGAQFGQLIGSTIGRLLFGGKSEREERRRLYQQDMKTFEGQLDAIRSQYAALIQNKRGEWWSAFDRILENLGVQWQDAECSEIGQRFPLLWQGAPNPFVNPGLFRDPSNAPYMAKMIARMAGEGCPLPNKNLSRGTGCLDLKGMLASGTILGCKQPYGCPYPSFPGTGGGAAGMDERVVQAFAAYDIWWQLPGDRQRIDQAWIDALPKPGDLLDEHCLSTPENVDAYKNLANTYYNGAGQLCMKPEGRRISYTEALAKTEERKRGCKDLTRQAGPAHITISATERTITNCRNGYGDRINYLRRVFPEHCAMVTDEALSFEAVNAASMRISSDLTQSIAIYSASRRVNENRSNLIRADLSRAVSKDQANGKLMLKMNDMVVEAGKRGRRLNKIINYGGVAIGAAILAGAVLKGRH